MGFFLVPSAYSHSFDGVESVVGNRGVGDNTAIRSDTVFIWLRNKVPIAAAFYDVLLTFVLVPGQDSVLFLRGYPVISSHSFKPEHVSGMD